MISENGIQGLLGLVSSIWMIRDNRTEYQNNLDFGMFGLGP